MATTTLIPLHAGKGNSVAAALGRTVDYIENPNKTDSGEWITSYECDPLIADKEFMFSKRQYAAITGRDQGDRDVIGYHLRISFKPGETDAATANKIGYDLAYKLTKGNHAFVCCTHVDRQHIHSHIVINSTSLDCTKKFRNFKGSSFAIRRIADYLCIENGLSIIANPKPSRGSYANWQGDSKPPSNREKLKRIIDAALQNAKDYDAFIAAMIAADCEVKYGKYLAFKIPGAERFTRCKSLGDGYSEEAILERLMGLRKVVNTPHTQLNLLIDIERKLQEGKGGGYAHWARSYNLHEASKTLIFLQECGIKSLEELGENATAASSEFRTRTASIKAAETRMDEIRELQVQISNYSRTREVYKQYRASGYSAKFRDKHESDIILHQAAKRHFDSLDLKKLPTIAALKQEYATLLAEKKKLYSGYREAKEYSRALVMAKGNVQRILGIGDEPQETRNRDTKTAKLGRDI